MWFLFSSYSQPSTILICFTSLREQRPLVHLLSGPKNGKFQTEIGKLHYSPENEILTAFGFLVLLFKRIKVSFYDPS